MDHLSHFTPVLDWTEESKVNADALQFFELVHVSDLVHQMVEVYFAEDIVRTLTCSFLAFYLSKTMDANFILLIETVD